MAKIKCPKCSYTEDDSRPHDRETYFEVCAKCAPPLRTFTSAKLRDLIGTEREQGRAFGPVAEQARTILAKREAMGDLL